MKMGLIRDFIAAILLCVIFVFISKSRKIVHKKRARIYAVIIVFGLLLLSCEFPVESAFLSFSSPESSFYYSDTGDIRLVLEGEHTAFVAAAESETDTNHEIVPKKGDEWGVCVGFNSKVDFVIKPDVTFGIFEHRKTGDCYIYVKVAPEDAIELYDNRDSEFIIFPEEAENAALSVSYYTYIGQPDPSYRLTLNGVTYQLFG